MGWFYVFKLHLICNEKGGLLSFYLTKINIDDKKPQTHKKIEDKLNNRPRKRFVYKTPYICYE